MAELLVSDGCRVSYDIVGTGEPLLLIAGLGGSSAFWSGIVPLLQGRFRVITFDHRGTGRSERPGGRYSIDRIALDAAEILDAEGCDSTNVIGHSTGGMIAQYLALDRPDAVRRLVFSGSWDRPDARFRLMFETRLAVLLAAGPEVYQNLTHSLGYPAAYLEAHAAELAVAVENAGRVLAPLSVAKARLEMLLTDDRSTELGAIGAPTLIIGATDDALIPFYHSQRLADAIPGAQLAILDGAHFFPKVHPGPFAAIVREFLEQGHA